MKKIFALLLLHASIIFSNPFLQAPKPVTVQDLVHIMERNAQLDFTWYISGVVFNCICHNNKAVATRFRQMGFKTDRTSKNTSALVWDEKYLRSQMVFHSVDFPPESPESPESPDTPSTKEKADKPENTEHSECVLNTALGGVGEVSS